MTKHSIKARVQQAHAATRRQHAADAAWFAAHPGRGWRVRAAVAGEFMDDQGHDQAPGATHIFVLTDPARTRWMGRPLTLAADTNPNAVGAAIMMELLRTNAEAVR